LNKHQLGTNWKPERDLPGDGGVFSSSNLGLYTYVAANPVRYIDPNGLEKTYVGIGGSIPFIGGGDISIFVTDGEGDAGGHMDLGITFSAAKPIEGSHAYEKGIGKLKLGPQIGYEPDGGRGDAIQVDAELSIGAGGLGVTVTGLDSENYGVKIEGGVEIAAGANQTVDLSVSVGDLGRLAAAIWTGDFDHKIFGVDSVNPSDD
jgi:hypothetical protein